MKNQLISTSYQDFDNMVIKMGYDLLLENNFTKSKPGSLTFTLWGGIPSQQSIVIRVGNGLESVINRFSLLYGREKYQHSDGCLVCGHQTDTLMRVTHTDLIEYLEQKTNMDLDTEKYKVTITKIQEVQRVLSENKSIRVHAALLVTSTWEEMDVPRLKGKIQKARSKGVNVEFMKDYFLRLGVIVSKDQFYQTMSELGKILKP